MTVRELIQELKNFDMNDEVFFAHPSHDHWRTELASPVENLDEERIGWTEYHSQFQVQNEGAHDLPKMKHVVLITAR